MSQSGFPYLPKLPPSRRLMSSSLMPPSRRKALPLLSQSLRLSSPSPRSPKVSSALNTLPLTPRSTHVPHIPLPLPRPTPTQAEEALPPPFSEPVTPNYSFFKTQRSKPKVSPPPLPETPLTHRPQTMLERNKINKAILRMRSQKGLLRNKSALKEKRSSVERPRGRVDKELPLKRLLLSASPDSPDLVVNKALPTIFSKSSFEQTPPRRLQQQQQQQQRKMEEFARTRMFRRKSSARYSSLSPDVSPSRISISPSRSHYDTFIKNYNLIVKGAAKGELSPSKGSGAASSFFLTQAEPEESPKGKLEEVGARDFGFDEKRQIERENEIKRNRLKLRKNKKQFVNFDDNEVDLAKFEELQSYIRDQEQSQMKRIEHGVPLESEGRYHSRKMAVYKKYFFKLIGKTNDPFITARHNAYLKSLLAQTSPSFYRRMEKDKLHRASIQNVITHMASLMAARAQAAGPRKDSLL